VAIQSLWDTNSRRYFEMRVKLGVPTPQKRKMSIALEMGDFEAHIRTLTEEKNHLVRELNKIHGELQDQRDVERELESITEECATVKAKYKSERLRHNTAIAELQGKLQAVGFERTKLEDQLALMDNSSGGEVSSKVLGEMQAKYTKTVESLKRQLNEKVQENENLSRKNVSFEGEVMALRHDSEEYKKMTHLLRDYQQQLQRMEGKLAEKEEIIRNLRAQLGQSELARQHVCQIPALFSFFYFFP